MIFFFLTLLAIGIQGLFVLFEMSILSLSKMRLQYFAGLGKKRALWLQSLLQRPSQFFGAILIGINASIQIGSECARQFYEVVHLDPIIAPLTQVLFVVILGELIPMFLARRHPTQISFFLTPMMVVFATILFPITWVLDWISKGVHRIFGGGHEVIPSFSREEIAIAFRERGDGERRLDTLADKIFQLKNRTAEELMTPMDAIGAVPMTATVAEATNLLQARYESAIVVYRQQKKQVVAILHARDLLKLHLEQPIVGIVKPPWFVTKGTSLLEILEQFRRNNQSIAVILGSSLEACGLITLDQIVEELFGEESVSQKKPTSSLYIERTLSGQMTIELFNQEFHAAILADPQDSLSNWIVEQLGHPPAIGDSIRFRSFVFTVLQPTLRGVETLSVRSIM